jgi:hypothetical protein
MAMPASPPATASSTPSSISSRLLQRPDGRVHLKSGEVELGEAFEHLLVPRVRLRAELIDRRARPEAADLEPAVAGSSILSLQRRRLRERDPEADGVACAPCVAVVPALEEGESARHDADNPVALAGPSQPNVFLEYVRVAAVQALPQAVAEDDPEIVAGHAVLVSEDPAERRLDLQHPEQRRCRAHAAQLLGHAVDDDRVEPAREHRKIVQRRQRLAPFEVRRRGVRDDVVRCDRRIHVAKRDEAIGLGDRERLEDHAVHDGEDRDVRAETDAERQQRGGGEPAGLDEELGARSQIADEADREPGLDDREDGALGVAREWPPVRMHEPDDGRLGVEQGVAQGLRVRELRPNVPPGILVRRTARDERVVGLFELRSKLLDDLGFPIGRELERCEVRADERGRLTHGATPRRRESRS